MHPIDGAPKFPMPNTFMAVAFDQGDNQAHGVHSRFKSKPAARLALQLVFTAFGVAADDNEYSGPLLLGPVASTSVVGAAAEESAAAPAAVTSVSIRLSHAAGLRLNDTQTCNEQFKRLCCGAGPTAFGARICTAATAAGCAHDADGKTVFNANVTIGPAATAVSGTVASQDSRGHDGAAAAANSVGTIVLSAVGVVGKPTFVDYGQTDFPQCSVVNRIGVALGPFGPTPIPSYRATNQ